MKTALVLLLSFAAICCAQENKSDEKKRLSSVTWDLKSHKLVWEVQSGALVGGEFVARSTGKYEISPDEAVMAVSNETRAFTPEEAVALHRLLDTLSLYCAESVVWWDQGQGLPVDKARPLPSKSKPDEPDPKRQKVDEKRPQKPSPIALSDLVAALK